MLYHEVCRRPLQLLSFCEACFVSFSVQASTMTIHSDHKTITLHEITAEGDFTLKVDVKDGMAGPFSNVSLKQFGASSKGSCRPVMSRAQQSVGTAGTHDIDVLNDSFLA